MREFDRRTTSDTEGALLRALLENRGSDPTPILERVPRFPLKVQIQTWTKCNAACAMCPYPEITGEAGFVHQRMDPDLYAEILRQLAGHPVERLSLFLMNEPLLDKRMPEWIALARQALPHTTLNLFTNGSPLRPAVAEALADAGLDELCISVHGFDRVVYERVMGGLSFDRMLRNVEGVLQLVERGGLGNMAVQLVTGDLPDIEATLKDAPPLLRRHVKMKAFSNERAAAEVNADLDSSARQGGSICQRPFVKLYILADGSVALCNVDWRRSVPLGRVGPGPQGQIAAIWNNARYAEVRRLHAMGAEQDGHICSRCDYPAVAGPVA